jgi:hypothetical protein
MKTGMNLIDLERNIQQYSNTTFLIVNIHNFQKIILSCSNVPHLLVELLNRYYTGLDKIIQSVPEVYVIDRTRDKYVIMSGAPKPFPQHAESCATVALKIKEWAEKWDLAWTIHQENISLTIGMHTGSFIGGVLGQIPKFVAMGDTFDITLSLADNAGRMCRLTNIQRIKSWLLELRRTYYYGPNSLCLMIMARSIYHQARYGLFR